MKGGKESGVRSQEPEPEKESSSLPVGWVAVELGELVVDPKKDLVDGPFGSNLKANEYTTCGVPVFKIQNIKANRFVDNNISYIKEEKAEYLSRHSFVSGDLIITKLGDPLGLCCKAPEHYRYGIIVADLMRLRPDRLIVYDQFLIYAINCSIVQNQFKAITKGTTRPRMNLAIVRGVEIPLPPLPEQQRIAAKIEELFSSLDKGIENLKTAQQQLKIYRQALLKRAFEGKLANGNVADGELPQGWTWVSLCAVSDKITDGEHFRPTTEETGIPFLSAKDVRDEGVSFDEPLFISEDTARKAMQRCDPRRGDILIVSRGATVGRMCIVNTDKKFCLLGSVILIKVKKETNSRYLAYALKSPIMNTTLISVSGATAQQAIYLRDIKNIEIPLAPLPEQHAIVSEIESRLSVCDKVEETINNALKEAESLRQSILKKAFEGKLVPQDPNDEPASILLDRIRKERAKTLPSMTRKRGRK
ncbi:MAG: Type-1 restriction enzyme EcoKI specificity protein [Syntrophorhabdus sp. PtaB.Bin006]|nr:MAG: Type-1 restriction enzyme EcoKI specificity protein [Syntrophorhabdus sp. PtaB.Bin006]